MAPALRPGRGGPAGPDGTQVHVRLDHRLPPDPAAAYSQVAAPARTTSRRRWPAPASSATTSAPRWPPPAGTPPYAQVLFLFLGLPGAVLAALLTAALASSGADRRRAEQALLRTRGAQHRHWLRLAVAEAAVVGVIGSVARARARRRGIGTARVRLAPASAPTTAAAVRVGRGRVRRGPADRGADGARARAARTCAGRTVARRRPSGAAAGTAGGCATGWTSGCSPAPGSCSGPPAATATSWCWPRKACRPSR